MARAREAPAAVPLARRADRHRSPGWVRGRHATAQLLNARAGMTDPEGDGHYVLERMWEVSDLDYAP